jgi:mannose-6-phosphate isomerase-like protein (cupin superfamily)
MIDTIRRVVTGETEDGRAVFTHVEAVEPLTTGQTRWFPIWGWDDPPSFPFLSTEPYVPRSVFPDPAGRGLRLNAVEFAPGSGVIERTGTGSMDLSDAQEYMRLSAAQPSGLVMDPDTGMHATDTVDVGIVISGEICVEQDGVEVAMGPGDVYVQNAAIHAWRNRTDEPCMVVYLLMSAGGRTGTRNLPEGVTPVDPPVAP